MGLMVRTGEGVRMGRTVGGGAAVVVGVPVGVILGLGIGLGVR